MHKTGMPKSNYQFLKMDDIRKELDNISNLPHLLVFKAAQHGIEIENLSITLSFYEKLNTHRTPVIKEAPKSGWRGYISAFVSQITPAKNKDMSATAVLFWDEWTPGGLFRGLHTGTGTPGTLNTSAMDIEFFFFLADFPKLAQQYPMYLRALEIESQNYDMWHAHQDARKLYVQSQADVAAIEIEIAELKKRKRALLKAHAQAYDDEHAFTEFVMPGDMQIVQYNFPKHIIIL